MKNQPNKYDGLRSVERRILFTMSKLPSKKKFEKSLRVVGHIIGKYHPYGVEETYDALARMTRTFSYRYPLVNGQGSFGSIADPSYVDARFTEVRLSPIGRLMVENIELCKMVPNYDGFLVEPEFLESRFPNILANGAFNDLGRYGGDEFTVVIRPEGEDDGPEQVAGIIRKLLSENRQENNLPYDLKFSIGYDELRDGNDTVTECMKRADKKLYLDKKKDKR